MIKLQGTRRVFSKSMLSEDIWKHVDPICEQLYVLANDDFFSSTVNDSNEDGM